MTYTATTWTTLSASRVKADYIIFYTTNGGTRRQRDADMLLTQINEDTGQRRTILGVVDTTTCEVIAAPDMPGFIEMKSYGAWLCEQANARPVMTPPAAWK